jgi:drug/metabolite transporter (DMT)-like permease
MKVSYKAAIALALAILEVSLWSIFLQIGGSKIGILPELFYGFLIGSIASLAISFAVNRGRGLVALTKQPRLFGIILVAGLLNDLFTQLFLGIGTLGTNPSVGSILYRTWPVFVALLTPMILRQKVKRAQYLATVIGFLGVYVIVSGGTLFSISASQVPFIGVLLLAAFSSTFSILIMNKYNADTAGAIAVFNVSSFTAVAALVLATNTSISIAFTPAVVLSLLFLGIVAYAIGTTLYYFAIKSLGPLITGNVALAVPFMTIAFSFLILGTPIEPYYIAAALLISAGILLQRRYSAHQQRVTKNKALDSLTIFDVTGVFIGNKSPEIMGGISGENRAFAIRAKGRKLDAKAHGSVFNKYGCISFTSREPHAATTPEEISRINEAMGLSNSDIALIGLGHPDKLEDAFAELVSASGSEPDSSIAEWGE